MTLSSVKTIIFDYDGTLHQSMDIYYPAFMKAYRHLKQTKQLPHQSWQKEDVKKFLGQTPNEMWQSLLPDAADPIRLEASGIIKDAMIDQIQNMKAKLYDGAENVLRYLKTKNYNLIILSNASTYYMQMHKEVFRLERFFDRIIAAQMYHYQSKADIIKAMMPDLKQDVIIIGDRHHDFDAAKQNGLMSIACTYGYGNEAEYNLADIKIKDISELMSLL